MAEKRPARDTKFKKGDPRAGRPKGTPNKVTIEMREIARGLINDEQYQKTFQAAWRSRELAPAIEAMMYHYGYGKPKETHELTGADGGPIEVLTRIERIIVDGKNAKD